MFTASRTQRLFFFNLASFILVGLWLTGFDRVHWFAWVIPAALYFAAATGLCLGLITSRKILDVFGIKD
jgi:hypothetical protein